MPVTRLFTMPSFGDGQAALLSGIARGRWVGREGRNTFADTPCTSRPNPRRNLGSSGRRVAFGQGAPALDRQCGRQKIAREVDRALPIHIRLRHDFAVLVDGEDHHVLGRVEKHLDPIRRGRQGRPPAAVAGPEREPMRGAPEPCSPAGVPGPRARRPGGARGR
jgi:hypothetical protein